MILCVDADNLICRAFYAIPPMLAADGTPTNAIRGFCNTVLNLQEQIGATQIICAYDGGTPAFRKEAIPSYKANRGEKPEELACQLAICRSIISPSFGWNTLWKKDTEADDFLFTMALRASESQKDIALASGDKDIAQCLKLQGVTLLRPPKKSTEPWIVTTQKTAIDVFGVNPNQIAQYLALIGDNVDNLPGIEGVGPKTASTWLKDYGSIENLLAEKTLKPERLAAKLDPVLLKANLVVTESYDTGNPLPPKKEPSPELENLLKEMGLHRVAARLKPKKPEPQGTLF